MDLVKVLQDLVASVSALQAQLLDAQVGLDAAVKQGYDKGFSDGVMSVASGSTQPITDKIYSQVEMDAAVASLNEKVSLLQVQLDEAIASIPVKIQEAIVIYKADLAQKYADMEVAEQALETGFSDLLK